MDAFCLIIPPEYFPELDEKSPEQVKFGFLPTLAKFALMRSGGNTSSRDEIQAMGEVLLDKRIDFKGYRLQRAEEMIAHEFAWVCPLDEVTSYYDGDSSDEYTIRGSVAQARHDNSVLHVMLELQHEYDKDLHAPGLMQQIAKQIDEIDS